MKNIQVIDSGENTVYDIFAASEEEFALIFPNNTNIAFIEEVWKRGPKKKLSTALGNLWNRPVRKSEANGIHGILFYGLEHKKQYYPTRRDEEAENPGGTLLRSAESDRYLRSRLEAEGKTDNP